MRRPAAGAMMIGAFVVAAAFVMIGPVGAEPTVSTPAPVGAPTEGDVVTITIDGAAGYDGAAALEITSCANSPDDSFPDPLASIYLCHAGSWTAIVDGDTFSGIGRLDGPVDGVDYTFDYVWDDFPEGDCHADAPWPCEVVVRGIGVGGGSLWTARVAVSSVRPWPTLTVEGPDRVAEGAPGDETDLAFEVVLSHDVSWPVWADVEIYSEQARTTSSPYPEIDPRDVWLRGSSVSLPDRSTIGVRVLGDGLDEPDETVGLFVPWAEGAEIGPWRGLTLLTIDDDDEPPVLVPDEAVAFEGDTTALVPFTIDALSAFDVTFDWVIGGHGPTTVAGPDFVAASGTATIPAGERTVEIPVRLLDDGNPEDDELIVVATTALDNARPGGFLGLGFLTVLNDEPYPDCAERLAPGANLSWCDLSGLTLLGDDLAGADLRWVDLRGATIVNGDWSSIRATGADLTDTVFANVDLTGADFTGAHGNPTFVGVGLDHAVLDGDFAGSSIVGSTARGAYLHGSFADAVFARSDFSWADLTTARYPGASWSGSTCADGRSSDDTFHTCQRMEIAVGHRGYHNSITVGDPSKYYASIWIILQGSEGYLPGLERYGAQYWFGPTGHEVPITTAGGTVVDTTGDGYPDAHWGVLTADTGLDETVTEVCIGGVNGAGEPAFGCVAVTVTERDAPPISPPASPPTSPPSSPPISGVGALAGLVPFLTEPIGLVATATGAGLVFLLGSRRAEASLRDDEEDDGVAEDGESLDG